MRSLSQNRTDVLFGIGIALLGGCLAAANGFEAGKLYFYQAYLPEALYWACGHGFGRLPEPIPEMLPFLQNKAASFDCRSIASTVGLEPPGQFFRLHLYLGLAVSFFWRVLRTDYVSLLPLVGLLYGAYAGGCYALLRLFFGRWLAVVGAIVLAASPVALTAVLFLRDFSKAPFIIWALVFLLSLLRTRSIKPALLYSAGLGIVVGIGCGFRADVWILIVIGSVALLVRSPFTRWHETLLSLSTIWVVAMLTASPVWLQNNRAGLFGTVFIQGLSDPFQSYLALGEAPYSFGPAYSDELAFSSVAADLRPVTPDWDALEGRPGQDISQSMTKSSGYLASWIALFGGDVLTQSMKSAGWIVGFPALVAPGRNLLDPAGAARIPTRVASILNWIYNPLGFSFFPVVGAAGLLLLFWREYAVYSASALAVAFVFAALLAYPAVQFSVRHFFHLEFIWVAALLSIVNLPFQSRVLADSAKRYVLLSAVVVAFVLCIYFAATAIQDRSLKSTISGLLEKRREIIETVRDDDQMFARFKVDPLPRHANIIASAPDSMIPAIAVRGIHWDVRAEVDRLVLTFDGEKCRDEKELSFEVTLEYQTTPYTWQNLNRAIKVTTSRYDPTYVVVPAMYRPTQHFAQLRVDRIGADCLKRIERVTESDRLPSILSVVLTPGWLDRPMHRSFGWFALP